MKMNKQLEKQILAIRQAAERTADRKSKELLKAYSRSLNNIRKEVSDIYAKHAVDGVLEVSKAKRVALLKALDKEILKEAKKLSNLDIKITTDILIDTYSDSYYKTLYTLDKGVKINANFALLNKKAIEKVVTKEFEGELFSDRIWKNKVLLTQRLKKNIENGVIEGKSVDKLARDIKNTFGTSAYESKRLINTELARVVSEASDEAYKESNVVKRVMYNATLDDSTSEICEELDGNEYDVDSNYPNPPQHPNCRCCLIPVIDNWSPTKRLDNISKETINYKTYSNWKKSHNIE